MANPNTLTQMFGGGGQPKMGAFQDWTSIVSMIKITQKIVDGLTEDTETEFKFKGMVQPLSPEDLALKPEGLRSWVWLMIHAFGKDAPKLETNSLIKYNDKKYKVMQKLDYSLNNYIEYHVVEDYAPAEC